MPSSLRRNGMNAGAKAWRTFAARSPTSNGRNPRSMFRAFAFTTSRQRRRGPVRSLAAIAEDEVREQAFAMPLTSPAYPRGPYRFFNREYFIITWRLP